MKGKYKIALVWQGRGNGGGISSVCWFIYQIISTVSHYEVELFSLETAHNNPINVQLLSPQSWLRGIQISEYEWHHLPVKHVGAWLTELEFLRYMPRSTLTELLAQFDLIQVVTGIPALARAVINIDVPICVFMATISKLERKSVLRNTSFVRRLYGQLMLPIVTSMEKEALKRADHVFAESEYTRRAILPYVDASKISIDVIGVDTGLFKPIAESERTNNYILSVGRLDDWRKNIVLLFEAYALLRMRMPSAPKLILAGEEGPNLTAMKKAKELGIVEHIVVKTKVPIDELIRLYQNAAMYVLSSDEEGLGIVLLEAMACATPVISTRCGGPDSVVSERVGFLTPVGDANALADRMQWMFQNPDQRRKLGQAGRKMVEKRFAKDVVGEKYLQVYRKLLHG